MLLACGTLRAAVLDTAKVNRTQNPAFDKEQTQTAQGKSPRPGWMGPEQPALVEGALSPWQGAWKEMICKVPF